MDELTERIVRFVRAARSTTVPDIVCAMEAHGIRESEVRRVVIGLLRDGNLELSGDRNILFRTELRKGEQHDLEEGA